MVKKGGTSGLFDSLLLILFHPIRVPEKSMAPNLPKVSLSEQKQTLAFTIILELYSSIQTNFFSCWVTKCFGWTCEFESNENIFLRNILICPRSMIQERKNPEIQDIWDTALPEGAKGRSWRGGAAGISLLSHANFRLSCPPHITGPYCTAQPSNQGTGARGRRRNA